MSRPLDCFCSAIVATLLAPQLSHLALGWADISSQTSQPCASAEISHVQIAGIRRDFVPGQGRFAIRSATPTKEDAAITRQKTITAVALIAMPRALAANMNTNAQNAVGMQTTNNSPTHHRDVVESSLRRATRWEKW
jgi:hypothetical protein